MLLYATAGARPTEQGVRWTSASGVALLARTYGHNTNTYLVSMRAVSMIPAGRDSSRRSRARIRRRGCRAAGTGSNIRTNVVIAEASPARPLPRAAMAVIGNPLLCHSQSMVVLQGWPGFLGAWPASHDDWLGRCGAFQLRPCRPTLSQRNTPGLHEWWQWT